MIEETEVDNSFTYKLENFEGPLDLLLEIIKKNKMDIEEVRLADITSQYLEYMAGVESLDMEKASEFILMASTLIEIKSKSLMPRIEETPVEEENSEELILKRLKEYQLFKETAENLKKYENINHFYREPDQMANNVKVVLKDMVMDHLLDAFVNLMTKTDKAIIEKEPKKITRDRFTVAEKLASIKEVLKWKKEVKFEELFEEGQTRSELINIFLATLELLKTQYAKLKQDGLFGQIIIYINEETGEK